MPVKTNARPRRPLLAALILALPLSGCVTAASSSRCPPLVGYTTNFGQRAAVELTQLPPNSALAVMIDDYLNLRDACRGK